VQFQDGRAWLDACPWCDNTIVLAHCSGLRLRLCRYSVPYRDALVLGRYSRIVVNVWRGESQLYCTAWFPPGKPPRGRLYSEHLCGIARRGL
jgi:hypothetical protein